jgi:CheY-like chemotaxis protein
VRRIRTDPALLSIPIIAVSSYTPSDEEQKAWAAGCDDFLVNLTARAKCWRKFGSTYLNNPRLIVALHMSPFGPNAKCRDVRLESVIGG